VSPVLVSIESKTLRPEQPSLFKAYVALATATFCWSSNVVAVKLLLREVPALPAGLMRLLLAAPVLLLLHLARRKTLSVPAADRGALLRLGIVGIAWSFLLFTLALRFTSVAHAVFIGALTPMVVLLLARLEGLEPITFLKMAGLLICLLGVVLLAFDKTGSGSSGLLGDLMAFAGLWCFSFYTVRSKRLAAMYDTSLVNTWTFCIAALFCLPLFLWSAPTVPWGAISGVGWSALLYSATVGSAGAYAAYYYSLRTLTASQAAVLQYVQPVLSTCFGVFLLGETWGSGFAAGAALILAGIFIAERR
jgi:drug/metabolite transporter (DMT)-like permease